MAEGEITEPIATEPAAVESTVSTVRKNPFGLEKPLVDEHAQEVAENVRAIQERTRKLQTGLVPLEEMTPSEKAAYLLKHLKD